MEKITLKYISKHIRFNMNLYPKRALIVIGIALIIFVIMREVLK